MNYSTRGLKAPEPVNLAAEADFDLGGLAVRPSMREVCFAGRRETVPPRVMQVLVVLAGARGAVVSRDQLIERCWGGRIVGDDAINSCIAKVRALAAITPEAAFAIETVPRVGYRLKADARPAADTARAPDDVGRRPSPHVRIHKVLLASVAAAVSLIALAAIAWISRHPVPSDNRWVILESHQPFISTPLIDRHPAFSPDGTMIAYSHGKDVFSRQIYLQLKSGGDPIQLTHDPFDAYAPAWSPDGTTIAYLGYSEKQPCRIMLASVPSGPSREIGHCRTDARSSLSWDRGGHALYYSDSSRPGGNDGISRFDIDSGAITKITDPAGIGATGDYEPSVSPDGRTLLFVRNINAVEDQVVLRTVKDGAQRVIFEGTEGVGTAWSSDSGTVFVARTRGTDSSLWSYPVAGGTPSRIMSNALPMSRLSSGPDGLLAMELERGTVALAIASPSAAQASRTFDLNGGANGCSFDYAPDGTLALAIENGDYTHIDVGTLGHMHRVLDTKNFSICEVRWSPDSRRLAYQESSGSNFEISVIGRDGMPLARIPTLSRSYGFFEWSADQKSFIASRLDSHGWRVWRISADPPYKAVPLTQYGWIWACPRDGAMYGMKPGVSGIWRIGDVPRRLTDGPSAEYYWLWKIVGNRIIYPDFSDRREPTIMAQPIDGGPKTLLGYADGLSVNGDLTIDPKSGDPVYLRWQHDDTDIGWVRLGQR